VNISHRGRLWHLGLRLKIPADVELRPGVGKADLAGRVPATARTGLGSRRPPPVWRPREVCHGAVVDLNGYAALREVVHRHRDGPRARLAPRERDVLRVQQLGKGRGFLEVKVGTAEDPAGPSPLGRASTGRRRWSDPNSSAGARCPALARLVGRWLG